MNLSFKISMIASWALLLACLQSCHGSNQDEWKIYPLEYEILTKENDGNDYLSIAHKLGPGPDDAKVTIYDVTCRQKMRNGPVKAFDNKFEPSHFSYKLEWDFSSLPTENKGQLKFCTKVVSALASANLGVSFQENIFTVSLDETSGKISSVEYDTPIRKMGVSLGMGSSTIQNDSQKSEGHDEL